MNRLVFGAAAMAALVHGGAVAAEHGHGPSGHAAPVEQATPDTVMPTDAALRGGMQEIRLTMTKGLVKRPGPADYPRMADAVDASIERITKTCSLPPEADERLHLILVRMMEGAQAMRSGENPQSGVAKVLGALNDYGRGFDHPGWRPFGH